VLDKTIPRKLTIRLSSKEHELLVKRIQQEGFPSKTSWLKNVVQFLLKRDPVLTDAEINALRESNRELAAIGRNLNQIAHVLNSDARVPDKLTFKTILELKTYIDKERNKISELVNKSLNRWDGTND